MKRCSKVTLYGFCFCDLAMKKLKTVIKRKPQQTLANIAVDISRNSTGIRKVKAKISFDIKVKNEVSHNSLVVCSISASSETWIPRASDNASAIANMIIPTSTASLD